MAMAPGNESPKTPPKLLRSLAADFEDTLDDPMEPSEALECPNTVPLDIAHDTDETQLYPLPDEPVHLGEPSEPADGEPSEPAGGEPSEPVVVNLPLNLPMSMMMPVQRLFANVRTVATGTKNGSAKVSLVLPRMLTPRSLRRARNLRQPTQRARARGLRRTRRRTRKMRFLLILSWCQCGI